MSIITETTEAGTTPGVIASDHFRRAIENAARKLAAGLVLDNVELLVIARLSLEKMGGRK